MSPPTSVAREHAWTSGAKPERFQFGLARTTAILDAAFRLVHDQYVWRGFLDVPDSSGRRVNLRHALPTTRVFVVRDGARVVGTATIIPDSLLGLPMDEVFGDQLDGIRLSNRRAAEISALAMDADRRAHGVPVLMRLLRMILLYAAEVAWLDDLVLVVRPQHAAFYEQSFACGRIGPARDYPKVHIVGAVAMHLDLHEVRALIRAIEAGQAPATRNQAFLYGPDARRPVLAQLGCELRGSALTADQFDHFFRGHDVLTGASPVERAYVEALHVKPGTPLMNWARPAARSGPRWDCARSGFKLDGRSGLSALLASRRPWAARERCRPEHRAGGRGAGPRSAGAVWSGRGGFMAIGHSSRRTGTPRAPGPHRCRGTATSGPSDRGGS
jgi:N-acyl amino acid synthase FeeM